MKFLSKNKVAIVRIIIGKTETGKSGLMSPTKSISLTDASVEEVYDMVFETLNKKIQRR